MNGVGATILGDIEHDPRVPSATTVRVVDMGFTNPFDTGSTMD